MIEVIPARAFDLRASSEIFNFKERPPESVHFLVFAEKPSQVFATTGGLLLQRSTAKSSVDFLIFSCLDIFFGGQFLTNFIIPSY